jgi:4-diphosphocytidyl-2-C-methyl-D-erythritol kinase
MTSAAAHAKINLALVVGPVRGDGKHEVLTVLLRLELADRITLEPSDQLLVEGFAQDSLVRQALAALAVRAGWEPDWKATIAKRIPVAAGLGGGSSDAATALRLANQSLPSPLPAAELHEIAARLGADVPFFLCDGPQLGSGDGSLLEPLALPQAFTVVVVLPHGARKESTAAVYADFDARHGQHGFDLRRSALLTTLGGVAGARDLARLPKNDLASSPISDWLRTLGAFRADVSGAGPAVYGLFESHGLAVTAARELGDCGTTVVTAPAW